MIIMSDTSRIFPKKIEGANPPSRVYDGAKRDMGLSYEELNVIINLNNPPLRFGQMRPLVHEIYNFSDGSNSVDDIARKLGFEFGLKIDSIFVLKFIEQLEKLQIVNCNRN